MKKWQPIAEGDLSARLTKKLAEIAGVLREIKDTKENPGLMGGKAGIALFLSYYAGFSGDDSYADRAFDLFSEIFDMVNKGFIYPSFASGLAGIGWTFEHLVQSGSFQADTDEILSELDPYLYQMMIADMQKGNYNYLHNALGIVLYFLRRKSQKNFSSRMAGLVNELESHAETKCKGLRWVSIDPKMGGEVYDLSLSRGLASIICILAKLLERGVVQEQTKRLLEKAVAYMLEQELDTQEYPTHFPSTIRDDRSIYHARLDWCFGDTGIAMSLWNASRITGNREWEKKALEVLLHATTKKDLKLVAGIITGKDDQQGVIDAGICHGAAGLAHIYNRIFQETAMQSFKDAALYWLEKALDLAVFADGYAVYKAWGPEKYGGWRPEAGLLDGIAGIGLTFLAAISANPPLWDEALLLS